MIDVLTNHNVVSAANQNGLAVRRAQSSQATAATTTESGSQYNFASIFGAASDERGLTASPSSKAEHNALASPIATATAKVANEATLKAEALSREVLPPASANPTKTETVATTPTVTTTPTTTTTTSTTSTSTGTNTTSPVAVANPGIEALVTAIMNGTFQGTNVTNPAQLQETTPAGTDTMPNFYYASDQTAQQLAQLLGGTVVQMKAFGQDQGWSEPNANFIQLPSGQMFNAADVAYYSRAGAQGPTQLTADLTQTINESSAWTNYYQHGGSMPTFAMGYVGPPIAGMTYPSNMIGSDGNVINPAMQPPSTTQGT